MQHDSMRFVAFLSYPHRGIARAVAAQLQRDIESLTLPRLPDSQLGHRRRLGRVFRDETDLSSAPSLSEVLKSALAESEHLILLLTADTKASRWVGEEVRHFIELGRRDRIVPILLEGEAADAWPNALAGLAEPLAIDARPQAGESERARRRRVVGKVAAALLHVDHDVLVDRQRRQQIARLRVWAVVSSGLLMVLAGLVAFALVQRTHAIENARLAMRREAEANAARELAETKVANEQHARARVLYQQGRFEDALAMYDRALASGRSDAPVDLTVDRVRCLASLGRMEDVFAFLRNLEPDSVPESQRGTFLTVKALADLCTTRRPAPKVIRELREELQKGGLPPADEAWLRALTADSILDARAAVLDCHREDPGRPEVWILMSMIGFFLCDESLLETAARQSAQLAFNSTYHHMCLMFQSMLGRGSIHDIAALGVPDLPDLFLALREARDLSARATFTLGEEGTTLQRRAAAKRQDANRLMLQAVLDLRETTGNQMNPLGFFGLPWIAAATQDGVRMLVLGFEKDPAKDLERCLSATQRLPLASSWIVLARCYEALERWADAESAYQRSLECPQFTDPTQHLRARCNLLYVYRQLLKDESKGTPELVPCRQRLKKTVAELLASHEFCPDMARFIYTQLTWVGEYSLRKEVVRKWLEQAPDDARAIAANAQMLYLDGCYAKAIETYDSIPPKDRQANHDERRSWAVEKVGRIGRPGSDLSLEDYEQRRTGHQGSRQ